MKKLIAIASLAALGGCVLISVGCSSTQVEVSPEGGWSVGVSSHMFKRDVDSFRAYKGTNGAIEVEFNGYKGDTSEQFTRSIQEAFAGLAVIGRLAGTAINPAVASVPISADAADAQSVASIVSAQSAAKVAAIRAKSEAALMQSYLATLTAESAALVQQYIAQKKSGTITVTKLDGTTQTVVCADGYCNPQ